jgi:aspartyl-tRNA(Asn)/glutamyl-tRNA(Gln) amidotransferase subunit A
MIGLDKANPINRRSHLCTIASTLVDKIVNVSSLKDHASAGITIALKDNIYLKGHRTTAGSRILGRFVPRFDADVVTRLRAAGAMILGKTNMHEFAFGVTNINPHFGDCRNPWSRDRVSGGSSGGSAVAVACGMACAAVGTDTAGSVRIPASLCGVVGYKPTNELISRRGIVPLAWSLDSVGFLTRKVGDAALLASLASGGRSPQQRHRIKRLDQLRIGVPRSLPVSLQHDVARCYRRALEAAEGYGAKVIPFDFAYHKEAIACRSLIVHAEAASYHRRFFALRLREYGPDLRQRLAQGMAIPAAVYLDALRARGPLIDRYRSLFRSVDLIALPTTPVPAPTIREGKGAETAAKIRTTLLSLTEPFNVYGAPAISIPCGLTKQSLPVGLQLAGDLDADGQLLAAAAQLEKLLPNVLVNLPLG